MLVLLFLLFVFIVFLSFRFYIINRSSRIFRKSDQFSRKTKEPHIPAVNVRHPRKNSVDFKLPSPVLPVSGSKGLTKWSSQPHGTPVSVFGFLGVVASVPPGGAES
jgi:hypothetical protein